MRSPACSGASPLFVAPLRASASPVPASSTHAHETKKKKKGSPSLLPQLDPGRVRRGSGGGRSAEHRHVDDTNRPATTSQRASQLAAQFFRRPPNCSPEICLCLRHCGKRLRERLGQDWRPSRRDARQLAGRAHRQSRRRPACQVPARLTRHASPRR